MIILSFISNSILKSKVVGTLYHFASVTEYQPREGLGNSRSCKIPESQLALLPLLLKGDFSLRILRSSSVTPLPLPPLNLIRSHLLIIRLLDNFSIIEMILIAIECNRMQLQLQIYIEELPDKKITHQRKGNIA